MGKQWKQCQTLFFGAPKITADGDCSHEIKRRLLLGRKVMTILDSIFKSKDVFPVDHNQLWKILKEMGILDHLICLLRNLYAGQEATVRNGQILRKVQLSKTGPGRNRKS